MADNLNTMLIHRPTLLLDKEKCLQNIERMTAKASWHHLNFRPHFKTHQSAEIGNWFKSFGVQAITVSSVKMAEYFAYHGWKDIFIAFPFNLLELGVVNKFDASVKLSIEVVDAVSTAFIGLSAARPLGIYIEIDTGHHRTGLLPDDHSEISDILDEISAHPLLHFEGFLTHAGQSYNARNKGQVINIHHSSIKKLLSTVLPDSGFRIPDCRFSIGDTPCCSLAEDFSGINEVRPGNFIFYDIMQQQIGSCSFEQIAVALACPVVSTHPERQEVLIHGGAVHLSLDHISDEHGRRIYGLVTELTIKGWGPPMPGAYVKSLSQEHGVLSIPGNMISHFKPGQVVGILPIHSCLTAAAMREYQTLDGEIITMMP